MKKSKISFFYGRPFLIGTGVFSLVFACLILVVAGWEIIRGLTGQIRVIELPGFHEMNFKNAGFYGGITQQRGHIPLAVDALSKMEVRVFAKDTFEEVPVVMNRMGQTFERLGMKGMPLFNFVIQNPGAYTLSGMYTGDQSGPTVGVLVLSQSVGTLKQTLLVGSFFFLLFLGFGIFMLVKVNKWAPKAA